MNIHCEIILEYENEEKAQNIENALSVDNVGFLATSVAGNVLKGEIHSKNILSLLHTLDDFLSCLSIAENVMEGLK